MMQPLFKRFIAIVGQDIEFIEQMKAKMISMSAISDVLSPYSVLYDNLLEIFKKHLTPEQLASDEKFPKPVTISEHEPRSFYSKIGRGVFGVSNFAGATFQTPKELVEYFEKKVGAKAYGEGWLQSLLLERMVNANKGVYLLKDVSLEQLEALKSVYNNSLAVIEVLGEEGEASEVADVSVRKSDNVDEETIKVMSELKQKWKKQ